jgi:hypothetical protein
MKTWLVALISFLFFIMLGLFSHNYLKQSSSRLCHQIDRIDRTVTAHQWPMADKQLAGIGQRWRRIAPIWAIFIHHQEIDNIENALVRLDKAIRSQDYPGSLMSSGELRHFLQHIPQREDFTMVNIL